MKRTGASGGLVVATTTGSSFTAALFVRDLLGVPVAAHVPRLTPAVPTRESSQDESTAAVAWSAWWSEIEAAAAGQTVTPSEPGLRRLLEQVRADAQNWGELQAERAAASYRPEWLPPLLARRAGSGRHDTEILPVAGRWSLPLDDRRILVSTDLYRDHEAMDSLWKTRISTLLA